MLFITNAMILSATQRAVRIHAPKIVAALDINPSILDRIFVSEETNTEGAAVMRHRGDQVLDVTLYPIANFQAPSPWFAKLIIFLPLFYLQVIFCIAHELRHVYQYETQHPRRSTMSWPVGSLMYHCSWIERDANAFSRYYLKSLLILKRMDGRCELVE